MAMKRPLFWLLSTSLTFALAALAPAGVAGPPQDSKAASASKHPDLAGVWFMQDKIHPNLIAPEDAPLTSWGAEQFKINRASLNPDSICLPSGVPRIWQIPAPFEIIPLQGRIVIFHEHEHLVRQIHMNRTEHPKDLIPTWMGDSTGHWEGDTLVVDTTGFNALTWADLWGLPHSEALHVVERIHRVGRDVLEVNLTIEDSKAYTKPWTAVRRFDLKPNWEIGEEICEENNAYLFPPGWKAPKD
jgi:hypothetical protein